MRLRLRLGELAASASIALLLSLLFGVAAFACSKDYSDAPSLDAGGVRSDAGTDGSSTDAGPPRAVCGEGANPSCPPNDKATSAIDVTTGGTFGGDLSFAHPAPDGWGCGEKEGRALFYRVSIASPRVYYFDTFGSDFDSVVRIFPSIVCEAATTTFTAPICADDACGFVQSQAAARLPSGTSCIVVAQKSATETKGNVTLHVASGIEALQLPAPVNNVATVTGTTCDAASTITTDCGAPAGPAKQLTYFFTTCSAATVTANTCGSALNTVLFLPSATTGVSATCDLNSAPGTMCNAGDSKLTLKPTGPGIAFVGVTAGTPPECGAFTMSVTF